MPLTTAVAALVAALNDRPAGEAVCFVTDRLPQLHSGGAATYNRALVDACLKLGRRVRVVVTAPQLPAAVFSAEAEPGVEVVYVHAVRIGRWFVASSPSALARLAKSLLPRRPRGASRRVTMERHPGARELARGRRLVGVPAAVFASTIFRAGFVPDEASLKVLVAHDVFHERVRSFERNGFEVLPRITEEAERSVVERFDAVIAISASDAAALEALVPGRGVRTVYPVGPAGAPVARSALGRRILYLGTAAHHNVDGMVWFSEAVWPRVRALVPDAGLEVVGTVCESMTTAPGIVLHGRVPDLTAVAAGCSFAVNPIRMGSGIKIKMVDYLSMGLPCVTTSVGAAGFPTPNSAPFVVRDEPEAMAAAIVGWLTDPAAVRAVAGRIPDYVCHFSSEAVEREVAAVLAAGPRSTAA